MEDGKQCIGKNRLNHSKKPRWLVVAMAMMSLLVVGCNSTANRSKDPLLSKQNRESLGSDAPDYQKAAKVYAQLGLGYLSQGQAVRAKSKLAYAMELAPKDPEVLSAWGMYFEYVGEQKEANGYHRQAIKLATPEDVGKVYSAYGAFVCRQGDWEAAHQAFTKALSDQQYANSAVVYERAGVCAARFKKSELAEQYYTKAIQRDSGRSIALLELSQIRVHAQAFQAAHDLLVQYNKANLKTSRSLNLELQVARGLGQKNRVASLEMLLKNMFPDSKEAQEYQKQQSAESAEQNEPVVE